MGVDAEFARSRAIDVSSVIVTRGVATGLYGDVNEKRERRCANRRLRGISLLTFHSHSPSPPDRLCVDRTL